MEEQIREQIQETKRTRRKISVQEKLAAKQAEVAKLQDKLAKAQAELEVLQAKADEEKKAELLDMIINSGKSEEEIREFFNS